ncbi:MAG: hypothetical protein KAS18_10295, partial [Calditrichia bacterium]|nr:hypothetical protein [Calditrichia bacterium]
DGIDGLNTIKWSENDRYLSYGYNIKVNRFSYDYCLGIIDILENITVEFQNPNWVYGNGCITKDKMVIYSGYNKLDRKTNIFSYNLYSKETRILFSTSPNFVVQNTHMLDKNSIYFIGGEYLNDGLSKKDIWCLNLNTNKLKQITTDGYYKTDLSIIY